MSLKSCLLVVALLVASATLSLGYESPEEKQKECSKLCEQQQGVERRLCQSICRSVYEKEREKEERQRHEGNPQIERENPYVFEDRHFFTGFKTQHGTLRILQKFTERSKLLRGIENFRVAVIEAKPHTFLVPNHWDADGVVFVANGNY